jgi:hypothetical protein
MNVLAAMAGVQALDFAQLSADRLGGDVQKWLDELTWWQPLRQEATGVVLDSDELTRLIDIAREIRRDWWR